MAPTMAEGVTCTLRPTCRPHTENQVVIREASAAVVLQTIANRICLEHHRIKVHLRARTAVQVDAFGTAMSEIDVVVLLQHHHFGTI